MDMDYYKDYINLGLNIGYYRRMAGYTQLDLAEIMDIDRTHIGKIELAKSGVSIDMLFKLSKTLNVPVSKFFENRD